MTSLAALSRLLLAAATLATWRRRGPLASTFAALLLADSARDVLAPMCAGAFLTGWHRVALHGVQAVDVGWPGVIAAGLVATHQGHLQPATLQVSKVTRIAAIRAGVGAAAATNAGRILLAYALAWLVICAAYPTLRAAPLFAVYAALRLLAALAPCYVAASLLRARRLPRGDEGPALVLSCGAAAQLAGAWAGDPVAHWGLANGISAATYAGCLAAAWVTRRP